MTISDDELLAERFETHRAHLRAVAYRMLGSQDMPGSPGRRS